MAKKKTGKVAKKTKWKQIFTDDELNDLEVLKKWKIIECLSFIFGERFSKPDEWENMLVVKRFLRILMDEFDIKESSVTEDTIPRGEFIDFVRSSKMKGWFIGENLRGTNEVRDFFMRVKRLDLREKEESFLRIKYEEEFTEREEKAYAIKRKILEKAKLFHDAETLEAMRLMGDFKIEDKSVDRGGRPGIDNEQRRKVVLKFKNTKYDTPERRRLIKYKVEINRVLGGVNQAIPVDYSAEEYKNITGFKPSTVDRYVKKVLDG